MDNIPNMNVSGIDLSWKNPYSMQDSSLASKITIVVFKVLMGVFSAATYVPFYFFEKYGGDPQKRGLVNQLLSQTSAIFFVGYNIKAFLYTFWFLYGSIHSEAICWTWFYLDYTRYFVGILCITELLGTQFLTIVICKSVLPILDDFFATFMLVSNIAIGSLLTLCMTFSQLAYVSWFVVKDMTPHLSLTKSPVGSGLFYYSFYFAIVFDSTSLLFILLEKRRMKRKDKDVNIISGSDRLVANTAAYNEDLMTVGFSVVALVMLSPISIFYFFLHEGKEILAIELDLIAHLVVLPVIFLCANQNFRKYLVELYVDFVSMF